MKYGTNKITVAKNKNLGMDTRQKRSAKDYAICTKQCSAIRVIRGKFFGFGHQKVNSPPAGTAAGPAALS